MQFIRLIRFSMIVTIGLVILGCNRDPNVKKQKYFESGNRYFEKGKYREAAIQFSNAIQVDPRFADAHYKLAQTFLQIQAWSNAYRELRRTTELDPDNEKAQLDLAGMLVSVRLYNDAREIIDAVLQKHPDDSDARMLLANLHMGEGDREAAIQEAERAIRQDPKRSQLYVQLASYQVAANMQIAEASLKKALALDPDSVAAMEALASIYQNTARSEEAEKLLQQAIQLQPKNLEPREYLARLYYVQNKKADAERVVVQAKKDLGNRADAYRVLGDYYATTGDLKRATAEFADLTKEHPNDLKVKESYIELLLSQNSVTEATKLDDEILRRNPKETGALFLRARILNHNGKFDEAISTLQSALKYAPENAYGHFQLGVAFSRIGDIGRAEQEWKQAAKLAPQLNEAQLALAQLALAKGDQYLLRQTAEQLLRNLPSDPRGYIMRANAEILANQPGAGEADIKQAMTVAPNAALGYSAMGSWLSSRGNLQEAQNYFEKALDRDPNEVEAMKGIVAIFLRQKQTMKGIERLRQQTAKSPDNDAYLTLLGDIDLASQNFTDAQVALQKAISLNKNNLPAFVLLSKVELGEGSAEKALATAYESIRSNPTRVEGYFLAGILEENHGSWQKAEKLYRQALDVEPNYPPAANNLAYGMLQHGENIDVALSFAQIARQKMPDSADAADTLAWAYYQKGVYRLAADLLQEAVKKVPDNPVFQYHLGMIYWKDNNRAQAKAHLERFLKLSPKSAEANQARSALDQLG